MSFFVYALYNRQVNKIYIGQTNNLERRRLEHNNRQGNHYTTKKLGTWELIYKEILGSRNEAIKREKQLKSYRGREFLKSLLNIPL